VTDNYSESGKADCGWIWNSDDIKGSGTINFRNVLESGGEKCSIMKRN
jgi:hypothetical protein